MGARGGTSAISTGDITFSKGQGNPLILKRK